MSTEGLKFNKMSLKQLQILLSSKVLKKVELSATQERLSVAGSDILDEP